VLPEEYRPGKLRRLEERAFQAHAVTYFLVNLMLVGIWLATGAGYFWPIWPIMGWGVGFGMHGWWTHGRPRN
jgi:hypothetical protein